MNIDLLIKMTAKIYEFFAGDSSPEQAPNDITNCLKSAG
jgi:hypothetical protein